MPEKDPFNYAVVTYAWVLAISIWGGTAAFIRRVKLRAGGHFSIAEWVGECVISGFVGMITFWLCESAGIPPLMQAVCIAITAHMGSRAILMGERLLCKQIGRRLGLGLGGDDKPDAERGRS
jgi:hypothetical protein